MQPILRLKDLPLLLATNIEINSIPEHLRFLNNDIPTNDNNVTVYFYYSSKGLSLQEIEDNQVHRELLFIDFVHGKNGFRHAQNCTIKQPLAKAVGIKPGFRPRVFDATAGLGADSFVLACLGCKVFLCERSPIISLLLQDALIRAKSHPKTGDIVENNMQLLTKDSIEVLEENPQVDSIYLDPMYPHRTKSALNKKEMRVIRQLVGDDEDSEKLFDIALGTAKNRVVVKRPKGAPCIMNKKPSYEVKMKNSRFDIYLC